LSVSQKFTLLLKDMKLKPYINRLDEMHIDTVEFTKPKSVTGTAYSSTTTTVHQTVNDNQNSNSSNNTKNSHSFSPNKPAK